MDNDELEAWKLCWHTNLLFYKRITNSQNCIVCSDVSASDVNPRRSFFWLDGTHCSGGHGQARIESSGTWPVGVCATCDQNYMLNVVKGKHTCRQDGCRRILRVHEPNITKRLASDKSILEKFLALVKKYRVYECAIHCDEVAYDPDPLVAFTPPTPECDHDRNVCDLCLKSTYERAIQGGRLQDLICPDLECKKPIPLQKVRENVSADVFKIYNKKLALQTLSQDERFRWCTCGHGQVHEPGENMPEWICLSCKKRHCYICRDEVPGPCTHLVALDAQNKSRKTAQREAAQRAFSNTAERAERAARERNTAASQREIARITKKCPKAGCGNKIERNSGCGHFTCRKCKAEFCWGCKVIWKAGKALHVSGCPVGVRSTVSKWSLDTSEYAAGWDRDEGYDLSLDKDLWLVESHR